MSLRLCLVCATVEGEASRCTVCKGALVSPSKANLKALLDARVQVAIDTWERDGVVDAETSRRLRAGRVERTSDAERGERAEVEAPRPRSTTLAGAGILAALARRQQDVSERWSAAMARIEADAPAAPPAVSAEGGGVGAGDTHQAIEAGERLFGPANGSDTGGGLEGLVDLDGESSRSGPAGEVSAGALFAEYAWWFLGTLLVLAGSVMGVREAWRALVGPPRQIVIAAALFGYHAMFLGLSALVARRSALAGRVLASIAVGLLPTVFIALAALVEGSRSLGLAVSGVAVALTALTLVSAGRRFAGRASATLVLAVLPSLVGEVVVGSTTNPWLRSGAPFVGLLAAAFAGLALTRARTLHGGIAAFAAALYAALALGLFAILGAPGGEAPPLESGSLAHAAVLLYFLGIALVLAHTVGSESVVRRAPHLAPAVELGALAGVALASCLAARAALVPALGPAPEIASAGGVSPALVVFAALPAIGAAGFGLTVRRHAAALHPAVLLGVLSAFLLVRAFVPGNLSSAFTGAALASALVLLASRFLAPRLGRARTMLEVWGGGLGLLATGFAGVVATEGPGAPVLECVLAGGSVALAAHLAGGTDRARLHVVGALLALLAAAAYFMPTTTDDGAARFVYICAGLAAAYGLAGLPHGAALARRGQDHGERPLDDASLALALLGAAVAAVVLPSAPDLAGASHGLGAPGVLRLVAPLAAPWLALALVLGARAPRDRSRLVAFIATLAAGSAAAAALGAGPSSWPTAGLALAMGIATAAATALVALRGERVPPAPDPAAPAGEALGRRVAGIFPIPFGARGGDLLDGVAAAAFVFALRTLSATADWLGAKPESPRVVAVLAVGLVIGALALAFVSHSHRAFGMRGSVVTLSFAGGAVGFAALLNRIGRPLPPAVVGVRLSLVLVGVWLLARLLARVGPRLAASLGRPTHGPHYAHVAHAGVAALGALLAVDAVLVGSPTLPRALLVTPPTMLLGAGLAAALLVRSFPQRVAAVPLIHLAAGCLMGAAALLGVQRRLLGPELVPLVPPGSQWVLAGTEQEARVDWLDPARFLPPEATVAGEIERAWTGLLVFSALALAVTGLLSRSPLARGALVRGVFGLDPEQRTSDLASALLAASMLACTAAAAAVFLQPALDVPPVVGLLIVGALALGAASRRRAGDAGDAGDAGQILAAAAVCSAGLAAFAGAACALARLGAGRLAPSASRVDLSSLDAAAAVAAFGPGLALAVALVAVGAHGLAVLGERTSPARVAAWRGVGAGRDALLVVVLVLLAWVAASPIAPLRAPVAWCGVAVALVAGTALHALIRGLAPRHAYLVQVCVVAGYALLRLAVPTLPPFLDALAALVYGFALVGASTLARRLDVPPLAAATRRFAAALPILVAVLRSDGASLDTALIAAGSGALYGALAAADKSRIFGALAAIAGNLALLFGALALGFDGVEAYFGPFGLLLLTLAQIFAGRLSAQGRSGLRIVGSLLLYVPAAIKLTLRLGEASDGTYSVLFGAVCFLGLVAGMTLRIRAYVVLSTLFVTLDVLANLAFAGLRDHRTGFVILSASGLAILATMIGMTFKRAEVTALVRRVRGALRGWD